MNRSLTLRALCMALVVGMPSPILADDVDSLRGIKALEVAVEDVDPSAASAGITKTVIQTLVELRLRQNGIRLLSSKENEDLSSPVLYVRLSFSPHTSGLVAYDAELDLKQYVILERDQQISTLASTWSKSILGTVGKNNIRSVREVVRDLVDDFSNVFLAANPKR